MYDNSLIVFSSDNGAPKDAPRISNGRFRGFKGDFWDGGMRVPAFVGGGLIPSNMHGQILNGMFDITDWYATMAHIANAEVDNVGPNAEVPSDSINQWAYLTGETSESPRNELVRANKISTGKGCLRVGDWKMVWRPESSTDTCGVNSPCLFNMKDDPWEKKDIAAEHPEKKDELSKRWAEHKQADKTRFDAFSVVSKYRGWQHKACAAWGKAGGFLVPWADEEDELH